MDLNSNGDVSLQQLMRSVNHWIAELHQLMLIRGDNTSNYTAELESMDTAVTAMEQQLVKIKEYLKSEADSLAEARIFLELSSQHHKKVMQTFSSLPNNLPCPDPGLASTVSLATHANENGRGLGTPRTPRVEQQMKEKRKGEAVPRWYVSTDEFSALSSYMKGRLTLEKVNAAVDEMAGLAEANAKLLRTKRQRIGDDLIDRYMELREISLNEGVKGRFFFLETDMRGHLLKLDNTGKALLTILRHLGRIGELRCGKQRVLTLNRK